MMKPLPDFFPLDQYGIAPGDVTQMVFHCDPEVIRPDVILLPWWQPQVFQLWVGEIKTIANNVLFEVEYQGRPITIARSGIGAPQAGDATLALGCTACQRIFFAGSVGALRPDIRIGDLMMPTLSYSGDGFCRYLDPGFPMKDCLFEPVTPDEVLSQGVARAAAPLVQQAGINLFSGPVYCTDSILSQFSRLDAIVDDLKCVGIEMETAAVFKAARMVGIRAAALFSVSDVPVRKQTLYAGRSEEERQHRLETRSKVLAKALLDSIVA